MRRCDQSGKGDAGGAEYLSNRIRPRGTDCRALSRLHNPQVGRSGFEATATAREYLG